MSSPNDIKDTPLSVCHFYRNVCGLPAEVDPPHTGRIVIRTGAVCGLMMPAFIGSEVKARLERHGTETGPILTHPRSQRWTFLAGADLPDGIALFAEMSRLQVSIIRGGGIIALPGPGRRPGLFRAWIQPPRNSFRPSGRTVVNAIRESVVQHASKRRGLAHHAR
ncbi:DNA-directed RNA polymerase subunit beta [Nocardia beijingensis]|uniref:DNA-directed RNA polymerase subunit beta n=1 Tax=Nocardia beijingensis TaxID=95162 RepID=UPI0018959318|nr:DNA-directed RNA polymerase subunit beta [Nocardia beijingensis]MBF6466688.1 DNA-directed RNA polymerase subunit beta [Nocardia beijingensis]